MVHDIKVLHHQRIRKGKKILPSKNLKIKFLDNLVLAISVIFPFVTLPQVFLIWVKKNAQGVSILTWTLYFVLTIPLLIYGIVHREKPFVIMYSLWLIIDLMIIVGVLLYG